MFLIEVAFTMWLIFAIVSLLEGTKKSNGYFRVMSLHGFIGLVSLVALSGGIYSFADIALWIRITAIAITYLLGVTALILTFVVFAFIGTKL